MKKIALLTTAILLGGLSMLRAQQRTQAYGDNILSASPIAVSEYTLTGVAIQYERSISRDGKWALTLPLQYSFGHSNPCDPAVRTRVAYIAPGARFYPFGSRRMVSYAVGPTIAYGTGSTNCDCGTGDAVTNESVSPEGYRKLTTAGMLISNDLAITMPCGLFVGSELGTGYTFLNEVDGKPTGNDLMLHFDLRVGYRF